MIFWHFMLSNNESNAFVLGCDETGEALLVDCGAFERSIPEFLEEHELRLTTIFITHGHYDHTDGLAEAARDSGAEVVAGAPPCGGVEARKAGLGDTVSVGSMTGHVLPVPGHTRDSLCLAFPAMVFTGDALFAGSIGGTSSGGQKRELIEGLQTHVLSLPGETEIHPGHGPSSTVRVERDSNPFFV
jgi:glyoxylase-like metal-dependent hydrolase (beta-lactamase superfamily II)